MSRLLTLHFDCYKEENEGENTNQSDLKEPYHEVNWQQKDQKWPVKGKIDLPDKENA